MIRSALLLVLFVSSGIYAQDAATIASLVNEPAVDAERLTAALAARDALTRATAARVVTVRGVTGVLPRVREVLATESDGEAAREQVRALALLGTEDDIAFAAKQLSRFPFSIDTDFAEALARRGAPQATSLYLKYLPSLRRASSYVEHALWGRTATSSATASLLMAADPAAFRTTLKAMLEAGIALDPGVQTAALAAEPTDTRAALIWYLVERHAAAPSGVPEAAAVAREGAAVEEAFGREVLRRMRGAEFSERKEWLEWLRRPEVRGRIPKGKAVRRHFTLGEQQALEDEKLAKMPPSPSSDQPGIVEVAPFTLPMLLPSGLGPAILAETRCRDSWIGTVVATVDRAGRVQALDSKNVYTRPGCRKALETMLRLSFADPETIGSPLSGILQVVRADGSDCFDEGPLQSARAEARPVGNDIRPPEIRQRIEPVFPATVRQRMTERTVLVVAEAIISRTGCVRNVRLVKQTAYPELNAAALLALSKWKFKPATLDGQPVDVIFNLSVNFKLN